MAIIESSPYAPKDPITLDTQEGYDLWSEIYDDEENVLIKLEEEHLLPEIRRISFNKALDCGCGTGRLSFWLRKLNPEAAITALDFSDGMLSKAKAKPGAESINWIQTDLLKPFPIGEEKFNLIVSTLVIEHINDFKSFFTNIKKATTPGANIFISGLHPAISILGISARFTDKNSARHILPRSYDHSISELFNAATESGLKTRKMGEFKVTENFAEKLEKSRRYVGLPLLYIMHLQS